MKDMFILPTVEYLKFNNIYSSGFDDFNFKIFPLVEEEKAEVVVWKGKFCFEKSELLFKETFKLDENFLCCVKNWLDEKYNEIK